MKITKCDKCPGAPKFDPSTAKAGTLMIDCDGDLCVRTESDWSDEGIFYLNGAMCYEAQCGKDFEPFTLVAGQYLIEND